jgi:hypothetical protein
MRNTRKARRAPPPQRISAAAYQRACRALEIMLTKGVRAKAAAERRIAEPAGGVPAEK